MADYKFTRASNSLLLVAGKRIKVAREKQKLQQKDVAKSLGVATTTISNYEQGTREMTAETAVKLSKILREPPAYLAGLVDDMDRIYLKLPTEVRLHLVSALEWSTDRE